MAPIEAREIILTLATVGKFLLLQSAIGMWWNGKGCLREA